jgi:hypothetical protein
MLLLLKVYEPYVEGQVAVGMWVFRGGSEKLSEINTGGCVGRMK